ncbi:MAG: SDR family NAD(P)-dependent oxidoreductase [Paludibacteraceae bacterium]|nr:SDR family NAD(P)-dependent oxidoreductase [Paludibacteraceae bacterium]
MSSKFALVTGASSGMGFCYAQSLAKKGYNLLMVSNEETIHNKAQEIGTAYPYLKILSLIMDLGTPAAAKDLYNYCVEHQLEVEVLINNAGVYHDCDFLDDSQAFNELILYLHVITPAMLTYYFAKEMVERHKGYILNMCSITDRIAVQRLGTYGATKAFLSAHTRSIHIELKNKGVFVTSVRPGAVDTGLYSISSFATKIGKFFGYIVTPEYLVKRALHGLFRGRATVSVPYVWNAVLLFFVALIPTCLLRLIRRWHLF